MERPLCLWIFLSAGVLWLNTQDVQGVRASSLFFGKSSTTTTTTAASVEDKSSEGEETTTVGSDEASANGTKHVLTGIPQIDYIWDPNLPKELNGYNLSDYPFYERVPENLTFKCDGLHDGFYASVPHKCQVYHHCLFGIRYDFLCANYTAFDQTLFNCNFVSNVDCENSKKFWNRNDELYITKTTPPPPVVYSFYTQSPPTYPASGVVSKRNPLLKRIPSPNVNPVPVEVVAVQNVPFPASIQNANGSPVQVIPEGLPLGPLEPVEPRRRTRPPMRLRSYYDYYDDYDEPPMRYRRKRPRPRPYYDDEEYEYYDDGYERRNEGRRRRPYDRPVRRYKGRRDRYEDKDETDYDEDGGDDRDDDEETRRRSGSRGGIMSSSRYNKRRPPPRRQNSGTTNRKPADDYYDDEYEEKTVRKVNSETNRNRNKNRRPNYEYQDEDQNENYGRNRKTSSAEIPSDETKPIITPTSGTIFDRPRVAPKINLPVPKNVADRFSYKNMATKTEEHSTEDEPNKFKEKSMSTTETTNVITTIRGNFKRPYMLRRVMNSETDAVETSTRSSNRIVHPSQEDESESNEEIQEGKPNTRQSTVRIKSPTNTVPEEMSKDVNRPDNKGRKGFRNRFQTRHTSSTPEARENEYPLDLTEIDDSINEA